MNPVNPFVNVHSHNLNIENDVIIIHNINPEDKPSAEFKLISIGIHPWNTNEFEIEKSLKFISDNAKRKNVLAIGECGLDKLTGSEINIQEQIFREQISIAEQSKKPLIIHCVRAFDELIRIRKEMHVTVPMIIHGYNNNLEIARQLLKNEFYFSFGKALLNGNSNASKIISELNLKKIFFETDDVNVSIKKIYEAASTILQMNMEELKTQIYFNFNKVFMHE